MKKNLARKIMLSILTGAVLFSTSSVWAETSVDVKDSIGTSSWTGIVVNSKASTSPSAAYAVGDGSIAIGDSSSVYNELGVAMGYSAQVNEKYSTAVGTYAFVWGEDSTALGYGARVNSGWDHSVALGAMTRVGALQNSSGQYSFALGYGSEAMESNVVSVGSGNANDDYATRKIVNVTKGVADTDAVNVGQMNDALALKANAADVYTKSEADNKFVKIQDDGFGNKKVVISEGEVAQVTFEKDKVIFGKNSSWYEADKGFFAGGDGTHNTATAKAALKEDGGLMGASGKFIVDGATGNVTAASYIIKDSNGNETNIKTALDSKANTADVYTKSETYSQTEVDSKVNALQQVDLDLQTQINNIGGDNTAAIAGLNQRLEKTNAKINKVGAGAAALAALHPLDYDPDDKLTFSAGMGNYAGENAAALGAFYRPNEKFMLSLGGTMGNGENMVNLGLSIGLDKPNGFAKMSKRELIQEVNAVKAENEAMKDQLANADERIAKLEALVAQLVAK